MLCPRARAPPMTSIEAVRLPPPCPASDDVVATHDRHTQSLWMRINEVRHTVMNAKERCIGGLKG